MDQPSAIFRDFVARLMSAEGADVELVEPCGLEFIAPTRLQQSLQVPEFGKLGFGSGAQTNSQPVTFESDWIQRLGDVLGNRGRTSRRMLYVEMPSLAEPERILRHTLVLQNAVYQFVSAAATWTNYLVCSFRYEAFADEKREGIVKIAINLGTSSPVDESISAFETALAAEDDLNEISNPRGPALYDPWNRDRLDKLFRAALPGRIRQHLSQFLAGLERRLERDSSRLFDYYDGLRKESFKRSRKQEADQDNETRTVLAKSRIAAIEREYRAKVQDLEQKYALKVEVQAIQARFLTMLVRRFDLIVKRRKKERRLQLDWNPLTRKLERPMCEYTHGEASSYIVCDDALHIVSPESHSACNDCGKDYCRACHRSRCPRSR